MFSFLFKIFTRKISSPARTFDPINNVGLSTKCAHVAPVFVNVFLKGCSNLGRDLSTCNAIQRVAWLAATLRGFVAYFFLPMRLSKAKRICFPWTLFLKGFAGTLRGCLSSNEGLTVGKPSCFHECFPKGLAWYTTGLLYNNLMMRNLSVL